LSPTGPDPAGPLRAAEPIRAELFGMERLEQHAESLAAAQLAAGKPCRGRNLLPRVRENGRVLLAPYRSLAEAVRKKGEITPGAEWFLDNFHVVEHWRHEYNHVRPHSALGYRPPAPEAVLQTHASSLSPVSVAPWPALGAALDAE
jgi:cyclic beta-1,2-glucan synthetase